MKQQNKVFVLRGEKMEGFAWIFGLMGFSLAAGALAEANRLSTQLKALEARISVLEEKPVSQNESSGTSM
ncbi:hypothetical protein [Gimesia maris]|uniref:hypothetical protein n=1 Tax=Gimesia maris TaxID=122 RepID=UPI003A8E1039